jgi:PelA/Pel-15E family pectate lyase
MANCFAEPMKIKPLLLGSVWLLVLTALAAAQSPNYLFAYFKNNGEDGLHLAWSRDGLQWRPLNNDRSFLTPTVGSQKLMRDPCIVQGPDGVFHMVWTTGWEGRDIGIAHSKDLLTWSEQQAIPVMAHEPTALNCWAPELFYDAANKQYLIYWSTTIPGKFPATAGSAGKGRNHRIYYVTTKDFKSYNRAALLYDGGFNVIDATIVQDGKRLVMVLKDETELPAVKKNLRLAFGDKATGPYSQASEPFTRAWVEGPTVLKHNGDWIIYYDMYRDHRYGALATRDWRTWQDWTEKLVFPAGARHGTVFPVSAAVLEKLGVGKVGVRWRDVLQQAPDWYASREAVRIADNVLLWQRASGGWPKNTEMAVTLSRQEADALAQQKEQADSTIDNGATYTQLVFLARVHHATQQPRFKAALLQGLDYLFAAQYANGGWPQYFPLRKGYYTHITYNDNAMVNVLTLLREVVQRHPDYAWVDEARRQRAAQAVEKGIECILKTQVIVNGQRTAWCAQHDEVTLQPAPARAYEKVSLSGGESAGIVRFLMGIEQPSPLAVAAIKSAVAWFEQARLKGLKVVEHANAALPRGFDRVVVHDAQAGPLWARFYEIGTNRPIFCGRDGIIKFSLAEIEHERRIGYSWYTGDPAELLDKDYPQWTARRRAVEKRQ